MYLLIVILWIITTNRYLVCWKINTIIVVTFWEAEIRNGWACQKRYLFPEMLFIKISLFLIIWKNNWNTKIVLYSIIFSDNLMAEDPMASKRFGIYCRVETRVPGFGWRRHRELLNWAVDNGIKWPQKGIDPDNFLNKECRRTRRYSYDISQCECVLFRRRVVHQIFNNLAGYYLQSNTLILSFFNYLCQVSDHISFSPCLNSHNPDILNVYKVH